MGDLSVNAAGAAARAKHEEIRSTAPVRFLIARLAGGHNAERAWRLGAQGEVKVGKVLDQLPDGWHVIHAVPIGEAGSDIDHVVIGPAGVFTLNTKHHPKARVTVHQNAIYVNGKPQPYLRNSRFEGDRASRLLTVAAGSHVTVIPVIVFVGLDDFVAKGQPEGVQVTTRPRLRRWFGSLPTMLQPAEVDRIVSVARASETWVDR